MHKGKFKRLFGGKNRDRINQSTDTTAEAAIAKAMKDVAVWAVEATVRDGHLSIGYDSKDKRPMLRFEDADSHCERSIPLGDFFKERVEFLDETGASEENGRDARFARFMLAAVQHFEKEERAGRLPE